MIDRSSGYHSRVLLYGYQAPSKLPCGVLVHPLTGFAITSWTSAALLNDDFIVLP